MIMENHLIQVEMIEVNAFYELAMRYNVSSVLQTNINESAGVILGAVPEETMLQELAPAGEM